MEIKDTCYTLLPIAIPLCIQLSPYFTCVQYLNLAISIKHVEILPFSVYQQGNIDEPFLADNY